jgi:hypothetical protein
MTGALSKDIHELAGRKTLTTPALYRHLSSEHRLSVSDRICSHQQIVETEFDSQAAPAALNLRAIMGLRRNGPVAQMDRAAVS